ncbi:MAG: peptidyl-alpha-hydroxyglycine alpha-amidating lyase family protein [Chloroflexota bacterium]|nr:peptidyl-alpha-hydroxyglycine alpha-amidating lyase family protein [Chloroflexota bacterium]
MAVTLGSGEFTYEVVLDWAKLPEGWKFIDVCGINVDSKDNVYVFNRGPHPMMVFDRNGNMLRSWGEGVFSRPHGVTPGPDGTIWCADDGDHTVRQCTPEGVVLRTIGTPGKPTPYMSGQPFNRPTQVAFSPLGEIYVSDGYGNARVHKYSPDGKLMFSWGAPGIGPGEFNIAHAICTDKEGTVYVADRESHRVQIFDGKGKYLGQWNYVHRPCGLYLHLKGPRPLAFVGELGPSMPVNINMPNIGPRVSVLDMKGKVLARLGEKLLGEAADQFVAPHAIAVDSRGDIYVGEVAWTFWGRSQNPPKEPRTLRKLVKKG